MGCVVVVVSVVCILIGVTMAVIVCGVDMPVIVVLLVVVCVGHGCSVSVVSVVCGVVWGLCSLLMVSDCHGRYWLYCRCCRYVCYCGCCCIVCYSWVHCFVGIVSDAAVGVVVVGVWVGSVLRLVVVMSVARTRHSCRCGCVCQVWRRVGIVTRGMVSAIVVPAVLVLSDYGWYWR